jgi:hypothetical protein
MLRITVEEQHGWATINLEGTLCGPWVDEVRRCWWETLACPEQVTVDLESVTSMDDRGRALLAEMHRAGTQLHGRGLMTNYILEQIQSASREGGERSL